jgi:hypothetical protein
MYDRAGAGSDTIGYHPLHRAYTAVADKTLNFDRRPTCRKSRYTKRCSMWSKA